MGIDNRMVSQMKEVVPYIALTKLIYDDFWRQGQHGSVKIGTLHGVADDIVLNTYQHLSCANGVRGHVYVHLQFACVAYHGDEPVHTQHTIGHRQILYAIQKYDVIVHIFLPARYMIPAESDFRNIVHIHNPLFYQ